MIRGPRLGDVQLQYLALRSKSEHKLADIAQYRCGDSSKWAARWIVLQHNILYMFESEASSKLTCTVLLEGVYAEKILVTNVNNKASQMILAVYLKSDSQKYFELMLDSEMELRVWMDAINDARYGLNLERKEQAEQKVNHLENVLTLESQSKWQNLRQIQELSAEVKKLRAELRNQNSKELKRIMESESPELRQIRKVQSFFRGWLCRRKWKQIVELYIKSPHAESMRTRNRVVFGLVEEEEEYVTNLSLLVTCYQKPFMMTASSKRPAISHDDVHSIFLNIETILFLHQIFLKGLTCRLENWPTLVIGDLFDILLPMLSIYQEYVRNHHYSLQAGLIKEEQWPLETSYSHFLFINSHAVAGYLEVLAECKQKSEFSQLLKRLEERPACEGRVLETFLTYPMHQIPKYILALHELLAHTPFEHVERKNLEHARVKLQQLSTVMHEEVSETENIRKNLAIERMIVEGCDVLLDNQQIFVRQGALTQIYQDKPRSSRSRLGTLSGAISSSFKDKLITRKVFLFTHVLMVSTRSSNGKLHLAKHHGLIPLTKCTLIEDPTVFSREDSSTSLLSTDSNSSDLSTAPIDRNASAQFQLLLSAGTEESKDEITLTFLTSSPQEKAAWCSDISQCLENIHFTSMMESCLTTYSSSVSLPNSLRANRNNQFTDSDDVKYSKSTDSCKVPQIRYASVDMLIERLTDPRFLSVDFLNTFLITYRVFTNWKTIFTALQSIISQSLNDRCNKSINEEPDRSRRDSVGANFYRRDDAVESPTIESVYRRRKNVSGTKQDGRPKSEHDLAFTPTTKVDEENNVETIRPPLKHADDNSRESSLESVSSNEASELTNQTQSHEVDVLGDLPVFTNHSPLLSRRQAEPSESQATNSCGPSGSEPHLTNSMTTPLESNSLMKPLQEQSYEAESKPSSSIHRRNALNKCKTGRIAPKHLERKSVSDVSLHQNQQYDKRRSLPNNFREQGYATPRKIATAGSGAPGVITSSRASRNRCSSNAATAAFAAATAGSSRLFSGSSSSSLLNSKSAGQTVSTDMLRCLNVFKHWIAKYPKEFVNETELTNRAKSLLEELMLSGNLRHIEQQLVINVLKALNKELEAEMSYKVNQNEQTDVQHDPTRYNFDTIPAIDIAEQLTYTDQCILGRITVPELLGQAWMKKDKQKTSPHILQCSSHFNQASGLVISEVLRRQQIQDRVACIEKWTAIADILYCMHNYNGVLQICAAFVSSPIYRLAKTWEKSSRQTRATIERLQGLVSSDARFKNMRNALHRCDGPCIPYLGVYLTDLSLIEEGSPNITDEHLVNFSKMKMIARTIREIQQFTTVPYRIDQKPEIQAYLQHGDSLLSEEDAYNLSLKIEPRPSGQPSHPEE